MKLIGNIKIQLLIIICFSLLIAACSTEQSDSSIAENDMNHDEKSLVVSGEQEEEIAVEQPPFTEGIFPCNDCHEYIDPNPERRELVDMHYEISENFHHDSENRWCLDCHDITSRDSLRLASGQLLDFKESYKLCGQCHGVKYRDWKVGVHGQRTGEWNGKKEYLLCVHCHDPHAPKFKELTPEPPPVAQDSIKSVL